jgi:type IV secretion system protein VirD4
VNDKTTAHTPTDSTTTPAVSAPPAGPLFSATHPLLGRPVVRYTALAVPATFLAAETTTDSGDTGGLLTPFVQLLEHQPLLAAAFVVGLVGVGYMKLRGDGGGASDETEGFASRKALRKTMGRNELVKKRGVLRPSLADLPGRKVPTNAVGVYVGQDRRTGLHLYMAIEDSSLMLAPMGAGKTAKIANWIIDAEGAVLTTSTKYDIVEVTERLRSRVGRIHLWNPQGLAGRSSNIAWDPVIGCADPRKGVDRARRRARYLLEGSDATKGVENRSFWQTSSYRVLKAFLWAAAADGRTLIDVARWAKQPRNHEAIEIFEKFAAPDPYDPARPVAPRGWKEDLEQAQKVEGKPTTTENIFGTLAQTFLFLDSPRVHGIIEAAHDKDAAPFDIPAYLESRDTLYLLGRDEGLGSVGPLFTAFVGEIYEVARDMAARKRGGRLDPPWSLILDEAALICSVPLPQWTADSRGLGISVHAVFQSLAQVYDRWGKYGAQTIWDNCTKLVLSGLSNQEHLEPISALCGRHMVKRESRSTSPGLDGTTTESVSYTMVEVPTMTPADIMNLATGEILVLRKHLGGPAVVNFVPVWERPDVKALAKEDRKATKLARKARASQLLAAADVTVPPRPTVAPDPVDAWRYGGVDPWTPAESGPKQPNHTPTAHLEKVPRQSQTTQLRKTGTDDDDLGVI